MVLGLSLLGGHINNTNWVIVMSYVFIWKLLEDIVENHNPPYCFEPCEIEELKQARRAQISKTYKAFQKATEVFKGGR